MFPVHTSTGGRRGLSKPALAAVTLALGLGALVSPSGGGASAQADPPNPTAEPAIGGRAEEGRTLSATAGTWSGTQPLAFAYRWVRCGSDGGLPDGSNCVLVPGATKSKYALVRADVNYRMRVRVTASNAVGSETVASNPTAVVVGPPVNTVGPSVRGSLVTASVITADPGSWTGRQPIQFSYRWLRCNTGGGDCASIGGGNSRNYRLTSADLNHRMRFNVTARNAIASRTIMSGESPLVTEPLPSGAVRLGTGEISIPAASVSRDQRMFVAQVLFSPNPVKSRRQVLTVRIRVQDTRGYVVRDALVFVRSVPRVTTGGRQPTAMDGWVTFQLVPLSTFPAKRGNVQFFVKTYRTGDPPLAGVAGYRLVQARIATR